MVNANVAGRRFVFGDLTFLFIEITPMIADVISTIRSSRIGHPPIVKEFFPFSRSPLVSAATGCLRAARISSR